MVKCTEAQRDLIIQALTPEVARYSCHAHASHVLQKLLAFVPEHIAVAWGESLRGVVGKLAIDQRGNYLLQGFLRLFSSSAIQFIFDELPASAVEIAKTKIGCNFLTQCIEAATPAQLDLIAAPLVEKALVLAQDQFGNYVIQHLLDHKDDVTTPILEAFRGSMTPLCLQKFSSNVIEKCLHKCSPSQFRSIVEEFLIGDNLTSLIVDSFGNFVVQTALAVAPPAERSFLVTELIPLVHSVKSPYIVHIQKKLLQV